MDCVRSRLDWFKQVILPHEPALCARLRRLLQRSHEAEDYAAETMARAYAIADYARITAGRAFLFQIARNLLIDAARRDKVVSFGVMADIDLLHVDDTAQSGLEARDELRRLQAIIETLPIQCRRVFVLRRVYDRSVAEIAEEMGLSVSTVEKHLTKAVTRVMRAVRDREDIEFARTGRQDATPADRRGSGTPGR